MKISGCSEREHLYTSEKSLVVIVLFQRPQSWTENFLCRSSAGSLFFTFLCVYLHKFNVVVKQFNLFTVEKFPNRLDFLLIFMMYDK